jgi:hypothetical protein
MKRSSFAIPLTALIYSYLFYQESPGINFLLFTLILLTGLIRERREVLKKTPALILMGGSILSATGIFITGLTTGCSCKPLFPGAAFCSRHR